MSSIDLYSMLTFLVMYSCNIAHLQPEYIHSKLTEAPPKSVLDHIFRSYNSDDLDYKFQMPCIPCEISVLIYLKLKSSLFFCRGHTIHGIFHFHDTCTRQNRLNAQYCSESYPQSTQPVHHYSSLVFSALQYEFPKRNSFNAFTYSFEFQQTNGKILMQGLLPPDKSHAKKQNHTNKLSFEPLSFHSTKRQ